MCVYEIDFCVCDSKRVTLNGERGTLATFAEVDEYWNEGCSLQVGCTTMRDDV
jgi:hypothetical protein